jgi:AmmeMemoRadiSam system protein A
MLTADDQKTLLRIARQALEARVRRIVAPVVEGEGVLAQECGAFVTIHRRGALRGCLGRITTDMALADVVRHLAAVVADSDPRIEPVRREELDELDIEISVLTPQREVRSLDEIQIGRHGVIVEQAHRRGLLLPQVATERQWDVQQFVEHTCLKAGLPPDAWRHGARMFVFEADVFSEDATSTRREA